MEDAEHEATLCSLPAAVCGGGDQQLFNGKQGRQRCDGDKGIDPLGDVHGSPAGAQCALSTCSWSSGCPWLSVVPQVRLTIDSDASEP